MATREEKIAFLQSQMSAQDPAGGSAPARTREEKIAFLQSQAAQSPQQVSPESGLGSRIGQGALSAVDAVTRVLDVPTALIRGGIGKAVGTENQGLSPWTAPSSQEIIETVAPSTAKTRTLEPMGPGGLPIESFMTPDEQELARSQSQIKPSAALGIAADMALGYGAGKGIGKAAAALSEIPAIQKGLSKTGAGLAKVGETLSGVPKKEIETYAKHADEIKAMAKASDNSVAEAADQLRAKWAQKTQQTRQQLNKEISDALKGNETRVRAKPVIEALEQSKLGIDADLYPEQIKQIDSILTSIKTKITPAGRMSLQDANAVKGFLQDKASSVYRNNGDIFNVGTEAAKSARAGGATARAIVNEAAPKIAGANKKLSNLHELEDNMNMNMLREGKPESSVLAAGSGGNARNAMALEELGKATSQDMIGDAEKLAAMRTFGSPKLIAQDSTGKAAGRMGLAGTLGYLVGNVPGAAISAVATSPAGVKGAIDIARGTGRVMRTAGPKLTASRGVVNSLNAGTPAQPIVPEPEIRMTSPEKIQRTEVAKEKPAKGPSKWANDGFEKLIEHSDEELKKELSDKKGAILDDPKLRDLLIRASDLKPGSKAMDDIKNKIKSRVSGGQN